ncbi:MAG: hypothetical protein ACO1SV_22385 [Fimbriimonas sp.]
MRTDHPKEDPLVELGYEIRDVNYKSLTKAVVIFFVFAIGSFTAGLIIYNVMNPLKNRQTQMSTSRLKRNLPQPPNPLLQGNVTSKTDMMRLREVEDLRLHGTGPIEGTDRVHIPVERAMELLVERGLPATSKDVPAVSQGNTTDGPGMAPVDGPATVPGGNAPSDGNPGSSPTQPESGPGAGR